MFRGSALAPCAMQATPTNHAAATSRRYSCPDLTLTPGHATESHAPERDRSAISSAAGWVEVGAHRASDRSNSDRDAEASTVRALAISRTDAVNTTVAQTRRLLSSAAPRPKYKVPICSDNRRLLPYNGKA